MAKITFIGAGSTVFARNVLGDSMCTEALRDSEIALYDINAERLKDSEIILNGINDNVNEGRARIKTYLGIENRKEALRGADFVVDAILQQQVFYTLTPKISFDKMGMLENYSERK